MRALLPYLAALGLSIALLVAAALGGRPWDLAALGWITVVVAILDHVLPEHGPAPGQRLARAMPVALGLAHPPLLALCVWALARGGAGVGGPALLLAAALFFGQVMNSCAHELIHARSRAARTLGRWIYVTLLFGHHASAHPGVHHVHVATPGDPNTARRGESWWRFAPRAWRGSFRAGLALEIRRQRAAGRRGWDLRNPYWQYLLGGGACVALAGATLGWAGIAAHSGICVLAQAQLLMTDYVQHYGLRRARRGDGWEPVGPAHAWNAPHPVSNLLTLHAPRHSAHHVRPGLGFEALTIADGAPRLPRSLPVMATLALWPAGWRRAMHPRLDALKGGLDLARTAGDAAPQGDPACGRSPSSA